MSDHDTRDRHPALASLGLGIGFVIAGVALLLHQLQIITLRWEMALPAALIALGVGFVIAGAFARWGGPAAPEGGPPTG